MIGVWSTHAQQYLLVFAASTAVLFSVPLFFFPLKWARLMLWTVPEHTDLTVYFGRCLGALALVINFIVLKVALSGEGVMIIFQALDGLLALMVGVHIYGAIKKIQPITETLEIGFWFGMLMLNLCFHPIH